MDIRTLTPDLSVAPQISPDDVAEAARLGFRTLIDNRPDEEAGPGLSSQEMKLAAQAAGMDFRYLPYYPGNLTSKLSLEFNKALTEVDGPVLAYCRSGNRSSQLWALSEAGKRPASEIVGIGAKAGYDLSPLAKLLDIQA